MDVLDGEAMSKIDLFKIPVKQDGGSVSQSDLTLILLVLTLSTVTIPQSSKSRNTEL